MGNTLLDVKEANPTRQFDNWIESQPEIEQKIKIFENKVFKSYKIIFKNINQSIILKIYLKEKTNLNYDFYYKQIEYLRRYLFPSLNFPGIMPYLKTINLDMSQGKDFVGIARQATYSNLRDKFIESPELTQSEKNWIIFQTLASLYTVHERKMYHGNIRSSNILLTSFNHVYLSDFGIYKPLYISEDHISDYVIHYERDDRCYLAPEKFQKELLNNTDEIVDISSETIDKMQRMDIFSLGCVLFETYDQEYKFLFNHERQYDPLILIEKIQNEHIKYLIKNMINEDPQKRMNINDIFKYFVDNVVNKDFYLYLYYFDAILVNPQFSSPDLRIALIQKIIPSLYQRFLNQPHPTLKNNLPLIIQQEDLLGQMERNAKLISTNLYKLFDIENKQFPYRYYKNGENEVKQIDESKLDSDDDDNDNEEEQNPEQGNHHQNENQNGIQFLNDKVENVGNLIEKNFRLSYQQYQEFIEDKRDNDKEQEIDSFLKDQYNQKNQQNLDLKLIIKLIGTNLRSVRYEASKLVGIELIEILSMNMPESENLTMCLPYLTSLFTNAEQPFFSEHLAVMVEAFFRLQVNVSKIKKQEKEKLQSTNKNEIIQEDQDEIFSDLYDTFIKTLKELSNEKSKSITENLKIVISQVARVCKIFQKVNEMCDKKKKFRTGENIFQYISTWFNNPEIFDTCLQYLPDIIQSLQGIEKIEDIQTGIVLMVDGQFQNNPSPRQVFFMIILEKYSEFEIYAEIQPLIEPYLNKEVKFIDKEILHMSLPPMIPIELINFNTYTIYENKKYDKEIQLFQNNYFQKIRKVAPKFYEAQQFTLDRQQELNLFLDYIGIISKSHMQYNKDLLFGQGQFEMAYKDFLKRNQIQYDEKNDVSINRQRLFKNMEKHINDQWLKFVRDIQANYYFKNIIYIKQQLSNYLLKFQQFFVQEELEIGKPIRYINNPAYGQVKNWRPQGQIVTTIYENNDSVTCLEVLKGDRFFFSGSQDGFIRLYDLDRIEKDLTADSILEIQCQEFGQNSNHNQKIKTVKTIEDSTSILYGTDKGIMDLIRVDYMEDYMSQKAQNKSSMQTKVQRYRVDGEIKAIETFKNDLQDKCFMYCTSKGEIGIKDIRQKSNAATYSIGPERGLISSLLLRPYSGTGMSAIIGTLNGYCLTYDIRCNMVSTFSQLVDSNDQPLPIMSMSNFYKYVNVDTMESFNDLVAISYASNNNEVAFFNLDTTQTQQASIYMLSTNDQNEIYKSPQLKVLNEKEGSYSLKDMFNYNFIPNFTNQVDVLQYLKDPLVIKQSRLQQEWLDNSKNCYTNISNIYSNENYANKVICYPPHPQQTGFSNKNQENYILTAGNDRNIRFTPIISDPLKVDPRHQQFVRGFHVCNVENKDKAFKQVKAGDLNVLHEFDKQSLNFKLQNHKKEDIPPSFNKMDKRVFHTDSICDMSLVQRNNGQLLITASRDKTIKIWK
ncbi:WD40-repeat-containing domain [Pseudocohnilembus persalinus]|uniref:WD40-repeat-containing domain n=1 Tax=Pseudocohnilembus persalinus TaxID=266149 RepID=A0A0V0QNH6_PSEPJ|nr:WD40-repeat-containing domain [Pseudocohnilembus persalinus]|eukprot:KRX03780.1 WD40-repeat-containing domain [Pseudocohnilembus persalinus]